MKSSSNILGSFLLMSACSAQPAMAQTQGPPEKLVDIGRFSLEERKPLLSLTAPLDKKGSKNLTLEFGRQLADFDADKSSLTWQIAEDMAMRAKYKRIKFTWEHDFLK